MSDVICSACGSPLPPGANFCADCGAAAAAVQEPGQFFEESAESTAAVSAAPAEAGAPMTAAPARASTEASVSAAAVAPPKARQETFAAAATAGPALAMAAGPAAAAPMAAAPAPAPYGKAANPRPMSVIGYLLTMLAFSIPIVGLVLAFLWAFGQNASLNRRNFARAQIIVWALILLIVILCFIFGGDTITTNFDFNIG